MDSMVQLVLKAFRYNRGVVESRISEAENELSAHKHGIFCFPWSRCCKLEKAVKRDKQKVSNYQEAEDGLENGNYEKAIEVLGSISQKLEETPWEVAMRIVNTPDPETKDEMLENIRNSPSVISANMKDAMKHLIELKANRENKNDQA